jgi:hypothetical protein
MRDSELSVFGNPADATTQALQFALAIVSLPINRY